ncbi:hypothetical protein [Saccharopolyspora shandongensis]|nr:hypothetical protein [Saccharopolyspora shandongensis]
MYRGTTFEDTMRVQAPTAHTPLIGYDWPDTGGRVMGVGEFATIAGVRALVMNHLYPDDGSVSEREFAAAAANDFAGPIHVSDDLDVIDVSAMLEPTTPCTGTARG